MARNKVRPNDGQQLKVVKPSIHESLLLQQQELQAQRQLSINKPIKEIPRQNIKKAVNASPQTKRLEASYKKTTAKAAPKPTAKAESRTLTFGDTTIVLQRDQHKLEALKLEAVEYWKHLPDIT